ncbi:hypothetical protein ACE5JW_11530 [Acinetobacter radioresistens]|uniref:hypothetical protein n=1 Tax=Acinetobacter TaxID=469 RepID=UPI0002CFA78E|nr:MULTISPECIES: hypothetical protein [Acinetobacter]ENV88190.1 hypothetical protein F940_00036 [Acinetobacter radioresistens NIPH 2130]EXB80126.1 hypothetical protein J538_3047 [Acinetobacter sp. 272263]MCK4078601.1 hypothetical protein [Acinetobacter radioresistens]MCK4084891.1 hypothetical protein [Acinetobacter radioresistens]MCK4087693.1 hypothetical protein [Acinetobacter radioresistens]
MTFMRRKQKFAETRRENRFPSKERLQQILDTIQRGYFDYYVKGGYSRRYSRAFTPMQIAEQHKLPLNKCLFEVADPRVERCAILHGLIIVGPNDKDVEKKEGSQ